MKYHHEVIGGYLRDPSPAKLAQLFAEDSAECIAQMADSKWSYRTPYKHFEDSRPYKTAKSAKKRMAGWR